MTQNSARFAELLTRAINRIHANERKPKTIIRDELGYAAGREGHIAMDNWCRDGGHVPAALRICYGRRRLHRRACANRGQNTTAPTQGDASECGKHGPTCIARNPSSMAAYPAAIATPAKSGRIVTAHTGVVNPCF